MSCLANQVCVLFHTLRQSSFIVLPDDCTVVCLASYVSEYLTVFTCLEAEDVK